MAKALVFNKCIDQGDERLRQTQEFPVKGCTHQLAIQGETMSANTDGVGVFKSMLPKFIEDKGLT